MKVYKPKKWLTYIRMFSLIFFVFLLCTSGLNRSSITITTNENTNKALNYKVIEEHQKISYQTSLYEAVSKFTGELTGYAGDCPLCSGVVACKPRINVLEKGIMFSDAEYGQIRMVASSKKYPCGTVLRFNVSRVSDEPIIAVIMDRGVGGNDIDLLMESESEARVNVGRIRNLEFDILRLGW